MRLCGDEAVGQAGLLLDRQRALGQLFGFRLAADLEIHHREIVQGDGEALLAARCLFVDGDGAPVQRRGVVAAAQALIHLRQIVHADGDVAMAAAQRALADRKRALVERLRLGVAAEQVICHGEVVQAVGEADALVAADGALAQRHRTLAQVDGLHIAALEFVGAGEIAQGVDDVGAVLVGVPFQDRQRALVKVRRLVIFALVEPSLGLRDQRHGGGKTLLLRPRRREARGDEDQNQGNHREPRQAKHGSSSRREPCGRPAEELASSGYGERRHSIPAFRADCHH